MRDITTPTNISLAQPYCTFLLITQKCLGYYVWVLTNFKFKLLIFRITDLESSGPVFVNNSVKLGLPTVILE